MDSSLLSLITSWPHLPTLLAPNSRRAQKQEFGEVRRLTCAWVSDRLSPRLTPKWFFFHFESRAQRLSYCRLLNRGLRQLVAPRKTKKQSNYGYGASRIMVAPPTSILMLIFFCSPNNHLKKKKRKPVGRGSRNHHLTVPMT